MLRSNKSISIIILLLINQIYICQSSLKITKENAIDFGKGFIVQFLGLNEHCLASSAENKEVIPVTLDHLGADMNEIISSMINVRTQIKVFLIDQLTSYLHEGKTNKPDCKVNNYEFGKLEFLYFDNSSNSRMLGVSDPLLKAKIDNINSWVKLNDVSINTLLKLTSFNNNNNISDEVLKKSIEDNLEALNNDQIRLIKQFKSDFTDAVSFDQIKNLEKNSFSHVKDVLPREDVCQPAKKYFDGIRDQASKLYKVYQSIVNSTLGCITSGVVSAVKLTMNIIEALINNAAIFIPGLNALEIIYRVTKTAYKLGFAIYFLYKAIKETNQVQKWQKYGRSCAHFLGAMIFLSIGVGK